jgi:hypothetical protein
VLQILGNREVFFCYKVNIEKRKKKRKRNHSYSYHKIIKLLFSVCLVLHFSLCVHVQYKQHSYLSLPHGVKMRYSMNWMGSFLGEWFYLCLCIQKTLCLGSYYILCGIWIKIGNILNYEFQGHWNLICYFRRTFRTKMIG